MTTDQIREFLKDGPKHMNTQTWIQSEIRYEEHKGIHTYHQCECGRGLTRRGTCGKCLREVLDYITKEGSDASGQRR